MAIDPAGDGIKRIVMIQGVEHYLAVTRDDAGLITVTLLDPDENRRIGMARGDCHRVVDMINDMMGNI